MKINQTYKIAARRATRLNGITLLALSLTVAFAVRAQADATTNILAQSVQTINRVEAAQQAQADALQKLLERIGQLEKRGEEQKAAAQTLQKAYDDQQKAHAEKEQKLLGKISELEGKVGSLEAGRVLPEIALPADDSPTTRNLQQQIRILERKNELAEEAADARARTQPKLSVGQNGFVLSSADTNFVLKLRGVLQADSRTFFSDNPLSEGNDSFILRRARPILEGTLFRDFDFQLTPDFAGTSVQIYDAYLNYRFSPELQLRAGKFKGPVGLENLQADVALPFNERGLPSSLVASRNVGIQLWGDIGEGIASYALGVFNGAGDGRVPANSDSNDSKEFAGRLFFQPFSHSDAAALQGFGFGVGASYTLFSATNTAGLPNTTGGTLPGYNTAGQQQFFAFNPILGTVFAEGAHWRISPQVSYYYGPFGFLGEYIISHQGVLNSFTGRKAELDNLAWQASAQWVLTGEPASFTGITPKHPFDLRAGQWGAWQLVARFGQLEIDKAAFQGFANPDTSASGATSWSVGINWWLNKNLRVLTSFSHTTFTGGGRVNSLLPSTQVPPATVTHQDENALFTRIQLSF